MSATSVRANRVCTWVRVRVLVCSHSRVAELANIPYVDPARAQAALVFHREIEEAVEAHQDDSGYRQFVTLPVVGTRQTTPQSATQRWLASPERRRSPT